MPSIGKSLKSCKGRSNHDDRPGRPDRSLRHPLHRARPPAGTGRDHLRLPRPGEPHSLGQSILVFIEVRLAAKSREILAKVRESFDEIADIMECHLVSGDFDYLLKARLGAMSEYNELLCRLHALLPATVDCRSYVVMEEMKESLYVCP
jgi:DNA-binding Lrp family transcriptional regulator